MYFPFKCTGRGGRHRSIQSCVLKCTGRGGRYTSIQSCVLKCTGRVVATRAYRVVQQQGYLAFEEGTRRDFAKLGGQGIKLIKVMKGLVQGRIELLLLLLLLLVFIYITGASEGNLVWYGQPSEVQFTRVGGMAEPKILGN